MGHLCLYVVSAHVECSATMAHGWGRGMLIRTLILLLVPTFIQFVYFQQRLRKQSNPTVCSCAEENSRHEQEVAQLTRQLAKYEHTVQELRESYQRLHDQHDSIRAQNEMAASQSKSPQLKPEVPLAMAPVHSLSPCPSSICNGHGKCSFQGLIRCVCQAQWGTRDCSVKSGSLEAMVTIVHDTVTSQADNVDLFRSLSYTLHVSCLRFALRYNFVLRASSHDLECG